MKCDCNAYAEENALKVLFFGWIKQQSTNNVFFHFVHAVNLDHKESQVFMHTQIKKQQNSFLASLRCSITKKPFSLIVGAYPKWTNEYEANVCSHFHCWFTQ